MEPQRQRAYLQALGIPVLWPRGKAMPQPPLREPEPRPEPAVEQAAAAPVSPTAEEARSAPDGQAADTLAALAGEIAGCRACALSEGRTQTVAGVGDAQADLLVIGEAPGAEEDRRGEPFVGRAGRLLDAMLAAIHRGRADGAYIANVVKCRPPNNRDPEPEEVAACEGFLRRQIAALQPRVILAVGRVSAQQLLRSDQPLGRLRGRPHDYEGTPLFVTYHPAYLLRNPPAKAKAWADLKAARRALRG